VVDTIEDDFRHGILALDGLTPRLEVQRFRQALPFATAARTAQVVQLGIPDMMRGSSADRP
jgi:hypothetical protein